MNQKQLNCLLNEFPWLWGIGQCWHPALASVKVCNGETLTDYKTFLLPRLTRLWIYFCRGAREELREIFISGFITYNLVLESIQREYLSILDDGCDIEVSQEAIALSLTHDPLVQQIVIFRCPKNGSFLKLLKK